MLTNEKDLKMLKAYRLIVGESELKVKGSAITTVGSIFTWIDELEKRMEQSLKETINPKVKKKAIRDGI